MVNKHDEKSTRRWPLAPAPDLSLDDTLVDGGTAPPARPVACVAPVESGLVAVAGGSISRSAERDRLLRSTAAVCVVVAAIVW